MISERPPKHLILFLAANPATVPRLALDEECRAIEDELVRTSGRDAFEFRSKWVVTIDEMMRHLNQLQPAVIHFSGHGGDGAELHIQHAPTSAARRDVATSSDPGIALHGQSQASQMVSAHALAEMIRTAAPHTKLVVLNACYTDTVADALTNVSDCVVGMSGSIGDDAARAFSIGFYRALGYGRSIGNAVEQANAGLTAYQFPGNARPMYKTRRGIDANQVTLPPGPAAQAQPGSASASPRDPSGSFSAARRFLSSLSGARNNSTSDDLFEASLAHYATVASATKDFIDLIEDRLIQWFDNHSFQSFVPDDDWRTKIPRRPLETDIFVSISVRGRFEQEKCKLEIGLWWRPHRDGSVEIYAGLHDVPWCRKLRPMNAPTRRDVTSYTAYLLRDAANANPDSLLDELEASARIARSS